MKKLVAIFIILGLSVLSVLWVQAHGTGPAALQSFEQDTAGWIGNEVPGPDGWCGDVTRYEGGSGPVMPAKGHG